MPYKIDIALSSNPEADALFSNLNEIVDNFEDPFELIREFISNSRDANAKEVWIAFVKDPTSHVLSIEYEDDGEGLMTYLSEGKTINRMECFFQLGKSDKRRKTNQIGRKGFGSKIALCSDYVKVETRYVDSSGDKVELTAELIKPYEKLVNQQDLVVDVNEASVSLRRETGTKIIVKQFKPANERFYDAITMKEYIQWFTAGGTMLPLIDPSLKPLRINIVDSAGTTFGFDGVHNPPANCDPSSLDVSVFNEKEKKEIDGEEILYKSWRFAKRVDFENNGVLNFTHDGKAITIQVAAWILGRSKKDEFANDAFIADRDRFGLWLAQNGILIQRQYNWVTSSPLDCNFHVIVNCDQFELNADRTRIKGKSNKLYRVVKEKFETFFRPKISEINNEFLKYKKIEEQREEFLTTRETNRKNVLNVDMRDAWSFPSIQVGLSKDPISENEVCGVLCALKARYPDKLPFLINALSPRGTDAVVSVVDPASGLSRNTLYEIELSLPNFCAHGHSPELSNGIICWELGAFESGKHVKKISGPEVYVHYDVSDKKLNVYSNKITYTNIKKGDAGSPKCRIPVYVLKDICQQIVESSEV